MLRTTVESISKESGLGRVVTTSMVGVKTNALPVTGLISSLLFEGIEVGDILKCDGNPYSSKPNPIKNMFGVSLLPVGIGDGKWALRENRFAKENHSILRG